MGQVLINHVPRKVFVIKIRGAKNPLSLGRIHTPTQVWNRAKVTTLSYMFDQAFPRDWPGILRNVQSSVRDELDCRLLLTGPP